MDIATILGVISAFGLVLIAIFMGGGLKLFINIPALDSKGSGMVSSGSNSLGGSEIEEDDSGTWKMGEL